MKKFNRISSMDEGTRQKMQYRVLNKVNLEEAEEERVHGNRVDGEAGGGDDVRAHHDEQDWDEAGKRNHENHGSRMQLDMCESLILRRETFEETQNLTPT